MYNHTDMKRELITVAVEHALLQMGIPELDRVESRLRNDYNCTIEDCLEHPEYLKQVLNELFGYCYEDILDTIKRIVRDESVSVRVEEFLMVLSTKQLEA